MIRTSTISTDGLVLSLMLPIYQRMAELWTVRKKRPLSLEEHNELSHCLEVNCALIWHMVKLKNLSLMAASTADDEWQHEICRDIELLERKYGLHI